MYLIFSDEKRFNDVPDSAGSNTYYLYATMLFGSGDQRQYFKTPYFGRYNGQLDVTAGQTTDVGSMLQIDPGYVQGKVELVGPQSRTGATMLQHLNTKRIYASGSLQRAENAQFNARGGYAYAHFGGQLDSDTGSFEGNYELLLGGLNSEDSIWRLGVVALGFNHTPESDDVSPYMYSNVSISNNEMVSKKITSGETINVDHHYCVNEVALNYHTTSGTIYSPYLTGYSRFIGLDYRDQEVDYRASVSAYGTPRRAAEASTNGVVHMSIPQGEYRFSPYVYVLNESGSNRVELPSVSLDVGCGQSIDASTDIQVSVNTLPTNTNVPVLHIQGKVNNNSPVAHIDYRNNDKPSVDICRSDCPEDGSFSVDVPLEEGNNHIVVTATDINQKIASVSSNVEYSAPEPDPLKLSCDDMELVMEEGDSLADVEYSISLSGGTGDNNLTCDTKNTNLVEGDNTVQCEASDSYGLTASCLFSVNLLFPEPENNCDLDEGDQAISLSVKQEILWPANNKMRDVQYSVGSDCNNDFYRSIKTRIYSNEPNAVKTSKKFILDAEIKNRNLLLRAERDGDDDGRIYLVIADGKDMLENYYYDCQIVVVPHDKSTYSIESVQQEAQSILESCKYTGTAPESYFELLKN